MYQQEDTVIATASETTRVAIQQERRDWIASSASPPRNDVDGFI